MPKLLQMLLIIGSFSFFVFLIHQIRKSKFSIDLAVGWVIWGLGVFLLSLFPEVIYFLANLFGVLSPINAVFLVMIFLLYVLLFFSFLRISKLENQIKDLTHYIAIEKKDGKKND